VPPHQPLGLLLFYGMMDIQCHRPSDAHTRVNILCKMCDGTAKTLAGGRDRQTDFDKSGT